MTEADRASDLLPGGDDAVDLPVSGDSAVQKAGEEYPLRAPERNQRETTVDLDTVGHDDGRYKAPTRIKTRDYDPRPDEDAARRRIAYALIMLLVLLCLATFCTLWFTKVPVESVLRVVEMLLGPIIALVSAATGFYYGTKAAARS